MQSQLTGADYQDTKVVVALDLIHFGRSFGYTVL